VLENKMHRTKHKEGEEQLLEKLKAEPKTQEHKLKT